jgi:cytochrome c nitrite reductase small subunit
MASEDGYLAKGMKRILRPLPSKCILPLCIAGGVLAGLIAYTGYVSRAYSYFSDDPSACINCHVMSSYYQSWSKSSHAQKTTCNDCHVPQDSLVSGYLFKAMDGIYHAAVFSLHAEAQTPRPRDKSSEVILANCVRCHTQLNTEFVKTGMASYADIKNGRQKACWDCHRDLPHTRISNLASAPGAVVPLPASPVPAWLKAIVK